MEVCVTMGRLCRRENKVKICVIVSIMLSLIFLLPLILLHAVSTAQKCPDLYRRFNAEHTFCLPPNKSCAVAKRGVTDKDKEFIVNFHNEYRSKVATGQESHAGGMPSAANMLEMVWDEDLASVAQKLAETCRYGHDCNTCRRVQSFSVGQNIGRVDGLSTAPSSADWRSFIKSLYDEVAVFNKNYMKPYRPGPHDPATQYGHFTQMVWATSWRIGCGWTVFKEGNSFTSYTVCNYGPGGNVQQGEMYKAGPTCSACPKNSCCGNSCKQKGVTAKYPGLCKVVDPSKPPEGAGPDGGDYVFYCDFNDQSDCAVSFEGKPWNLVRTKGGNWMSTVVKGGEKVKLKFNKSFEVSKKLCVKLFVRSGPNVDGEADSGEGQSILENSSFGEMKFDLKNKNVPKELRQSFMENTYRVGLPGGKYAFKYSFNYQVPSGAPPQFVEIKSVSAQDC